MTATTATIYDRGAQLRVLTSSIGAKRDLRFAAVFALIHLPLGIAFYRIGSFGIIHPLVVFAVGAYWALKPQIRLEATGTLCMYIVASEVLWRMVDLNIYWESGKYVSSLLMILALIRRKELKFSPLPILFFLLLIPGCFVTLRTFEFEFARTMLSFNMSGPLFLAVSCIFFLRTKYSPSQIWKMFVVGLGPLLGVGMATLFFTVTNPDLQFTGESNEATSGGFGPNQVSSMLGLGAFLAVGLLLLFKSTNKEKLLFGIAALFLAAQSVLTFSRGGMYNAVGALIMLFLFLVKDFRGLVRRAVPVVVIAAIFLFFIFPALDEYTGGMLGDRFENTKTTNRFEIVQSDFQILAENPIIGVGVGVAKGYRERYLEFSSASHTEFSRLIAEHGILGIGAMMCMLIMAYSAVSREKQGFAKAIKAGVIAWCLLFMMNAGMRLAAPSLLFGLGMTSLATTGIRRKLTPQKRPNVGKFDNAS